jgi:hypothetical protein
MVALEPHPEQGPNKINMKQKGTGNLVEASVRYSETGKSGITGRIKKIFDVTVISKEKLTIP